MTNLVYWGQVAHTRFAPQEHSFTYPMFFFGIDLLEHKESGFKLFPLLDTRYPSLLKVRNQDYLENTNAPILDKLVSILHRFGDEQEFTRAVLVTMPRVLGYIFNPVNFYLCFSKDENVTSVICEVRNTFGEKYLYHSASGTRASNSNTIEFPLTKEFYVSPFIDMTGNYTIGVTYEANYTSMKVLLQQNGLPLLSAELTGVPQPFNRTNIIGTLIKFPFCNLLTMCRIHWQAVVLMGLRGVSVFMKPALNPSWRGQSSPSWVYTVRHKFLGFVKALGNK